MKANQNKDTHFDAIVVGAGFSGIYMLYRLREAGFSTHAFEAGVDVGGVWYWNRYPGARCDSESIYYNYTFSEEIYKGWTWTSKYPDQPEILQYLNYVADTLDIRKDFSFQTRVTSAHYDEENKIWRIETDKGKSVTATYFITGVGCISASNIPKINGLESFEGEWYHTGHWPHEKVSFKGKKVGIIGTGSSGIQAIPVVAKEAEHLTVFQRTAQYSVPARNEPYKMGYVQNAKDHFKEIKQKVRDSGGGLPITPSNISALDVTEQEREETYGRLWEKGGPALMTESYNDILINEEANESVASFVRKKIRETVKDPDVAEKLTPSYYFAAKRIVLDTDYFETYNRENVSLVDIKKSPIDQITPKGIKTSEKEYDLDVIIFATGFDGMTGPLLKMDIRGKQGISLREKWNNGAQTRTYLGLANAGFPNFFMITGPESPSVLGNMPVAIEQHVEWIADCIEHLRNIGADEIEATVQAEEEWSKHCREMAESTLYTKTNSWYTGSNIEGKPRGFLIYVGGYGPYRKICDEVVENGYEGFRLAYSLKTLS